MKIFYLMFNILFNALKHVFDVRVKYLVMNMLLILKDFLNETNIVE